MDFSFLFFFSSRNVNLITSLVITSLFFGQLAIHPQMNFDKACNDNLMCFCKLSQMKFFIQRWKDKILITKNFYRSFSNRTCPLCSGQVLDTSLL